MQARVPKFTTNSTTLPLLCAFMDDLRLMSAKVSGAQTLLSWCITALNWAGLEFRADKSHCIVIVKGRSMNIAPRPIKFLGCIIDGSVSDETLQQN